MTNQHTPGPWFASDFRHIGKYPGVDIGADNGANVAWVLHQENDREESETVANGRLIAAAPDLLRCLVNLLEEYQGVVDPDRTNRNGFNDYEEVIEARAALAKATGEQA